MTPQAVSEVCIRLSYFLISTALYFWFQILRDEEFTSGDLYPEGSAPVRFFDTNKLASNIPIEDSHSEAILHPSKTGEPPGMIFGVFDGHGGQSCGIVTAYRLQHYTAVALLEREDLRQHLEDLCAAGDDPDAVAETMAKLITVFDNVEMVTDLRKIHQRSYIDFVKEQLRCARKKLFERIFLKPNFRERVLEAEENRSLTITERISSAFKALDNDMSREAVENSDADDDLAMITATVAMSGSVAVMAYIEGRYKKSTKLINHLTDFDFQVPCSM